jgi:hypothetical protein
MPGIANESSTSPMNYRHPRPIFLSPMSCFHRQDNILVADDLSSRSRHYPHRSDNILKRRTASSSPINYLIRRENRFYYAYKHMLIVSTTVRLPVDGSFAIRIIQWRSGSFIDDAENSLAMRALNEQTGKMLLAPYLLD